MTDRYAGDVMSLQLFTTVCGAAITAALSGLGPTVLRRMSVSSAAECRRVPTPASSSGDSNRRSVTSPGAVELRLGYREIAAAPNVGCWLAIAGALTGAMIAHALGGNSSSPAWWYLTAVGVLLSYVDARLRVLPTRIIAPSYAIVFVLLVAGALHENSLSPLAGAVLGWAVLGGVYFILWFLYPSGMGYGDVRLAGLLGLGLGYLGWAELVTGLSAGLLLGGIGGLVLVFVRRLPDRHYPFGPFMVAGALLAVCFGAPLDGWYLSLVT